MGVDSWISLASKSLDENVKAVLFSLCAVVWLRVVDMF